MVFEVLLWAVYISNLTVCAYSLASQKNKDLILNRSCMRNIPTASITITYFFIWSKRAINKTKINDIINPPTIQIKPCDILSNNRKLTSIETTFAIIKIMN